MSLFVFMFLNILLHSLFFLVFCNLSIKKIYYVLNSTVVYLCSGQYVWIMQMTIYGRYHSKLKTLIEPIQDEGGVYSSTNDYLQALRTACDDAGALLVFDEVGNLHFCLHEYAVLFSSKLCDWLGVSITPFFLKF